MHFEMYFSERKNSMRSFYQRVGCILDPAPSISTFTLCELQHASFLMVLKEATVSSVSYHCHMLYFLLELPTAMIFLHLACSSSPDSALMLLLERDLLCPASFFFFQPHYLSSYSISSHVLPSEKIFPLLAFLCSELPTRILSP